MDKGNESKTPARASFRANRRTLLKASALTAPAILTLRSGAALANSSTTCDTQPPPCEVIENTSDTYIRAIARYATYSVEAINLTDRILSPTEKNEICTKINKVFVNLNCDPDAASMNAIGPGANIFLGLQDLLVLQTAAGTHTQNPGTFDLTPGDRYQAYTIPNDTCNTALTDTNDLIFPNKNFTNKEYFVIKKKKPIYKIIVREDTFHNFSFVLCFFDSDHSNPVVFPGATGNANNTIPLTTSCMISVM